MFLLVSVLALVGCFGGSDDDSYSYVPDNSLNSSPVAVPAAKVLDATTAPVASPTVQVQQAVTESLKTLVNEVRLSERQTLRASAVPSGIPGFTGNQATNINWLLGNLLAALPNGGNITNGVFLENTDPNSWKYQIATYTPSTKTLEVAEVKTDYVYNGSVPPTMNKYIQQTIEITNCDATVSEGNLSKMTVGNGSKITTKFFNKDGSLNGSLAITVSGGISIELANTLSASNEFVSMSTYGTRSYGFLKSLSGTESTKLTFTGAATFDVAFEEGINKVTGAITINNLTGTYTMTEDIAFGVSATKDGSNTPVAVQNSYVRKEYFGNEGHSNNLTFAGNSFQFGFNVSWAGEGVGENAGILLENGLIQIKNIVRKTPKQGEPDANYAFSDGSASMLVRYTGKNFEKFGYIYSLKFAISGLAFDPDSSTEAGEGAMIQIVRTNSDNTQSNLTYKMVGGKPVLQPSEMAFAGGSEKVTVEGTTTTVTGNVTMANSSDAPADAQMQIAYESKKDTVNNTIKTRATVKLGSARRTMFFTRDAEKKVNGNVYNGDQAADSGTTEGTFTVDSNGNGSVKIGTNASENFKVEL